MNRQRPANAPKRAGATQETASRGCAEQPHRNLVSSVSETCYRQHDRADELENENAHAQTHKRFQLPWLFSEHTRTYCDTALVTTQISVAGSLSRRADCFRDRPLG